MAKGKSQVLITFMLLPIECSYLAMTIMRNKRYRKTKRQEKTIKH
jgi:hypothetical protein